MVDRDVTAVAMEVSSHALALHRVDGTKFEVVAFTNLSQDHLDFHADLDDYFAAKARLFTADFARVGVVNVDDEHGRTLSERATIPMVTVSANGGEATWSVRDVVATAAGSQFVVTGPAGDTALTVNLPGHFNVANALVAFATLVAAGVDASCGCSRNRRTRFRAWPDGSRRGRPAVRRTRRLRAHARGGRDAAHDLAGHDSRPS